MQWHPHNTVATVIEHKRKFLMVEERINGQAVLNQPAGHLEPGESLLQAAIRETLEETAWEVELQALLGVYQFVSPANGECYIRTCFIATAIREQVGRQLDRDIERALWMDLSEIEAAANRLRNPVVMRVIQDYLAGQRHPLDTLRIMEQPA